MVELCRLNLETITDRVIFFLSNFFRHEAVSCVTSSAGVRMRRFLTRYRIIWSVTVKQSTWRINNKLVLKILLTVLTLNCLINLEISIK